MTAFLSGEMKDTVEMNPAGTYGEHLSQGNRRPLQISWGSLVLERFFSRKERACLFRSWAGSASLWIKVTSITQ